MQRLTAAIFATLRNFLLSLPHSFCAIFAFCWWDLGGWAWAAAACEDGLGGRLEAGGRGWREVSGSGWAESPCCGCILGAGYGRLLGEVDWAELFLLIGVRLWPARGHLASPGGLRRRNGGEISGPRSPQPPVPQLSSKEIELSGGSASAGGAAVITTTTKTRNANAIITNTI